jgi:hypothetical protein
VRVLRREIIGVTLVLIALGGLWLWQQGQAVPRPADAVVVAESVNTPGVRVTTLDVPLAEDDVRGFYQQALTARGWRYCGTQATPGCTNIFMALAGEESAIDVYRQADAAEGAGRTIEIWPQPQENGTRVRVYETSEMMSR